MSASGDEKKSIDVKAALAKIAQDKAQAQLKASSIKEAKATKTIPVAQAKADVAKAFDVVEQKIVPVKTQVGLKKTQIKTNVNRAKENTVKITENIADAQNKLNELNSLIADVSANPSDYQIEDPNTGKLRKLVGNDIDGYKRTASELEKYIKSGKASVSELNDFVKKGDLSVTQLNSWLSNYERKQKDLVEGYQGVPSPVDFVGPKLESKEVVMKRVLDSGLVEPKPGNKYGLTKGIQYLTDQEERDLLRVGFDIPELKESLSWKLLEKANKETRTDAVGPLGIRYSPKGAKQVEALGVAGAEMVISGYLNLLKKEDQGILDRRGKQFVDLANIEKVIPNITTGQAKAAKMVGYGTGAGLNAVTLAAVGAVVGTGVGSVGQAAVDTKIGGNIIRTIGDLASKLGPYAKVAEKVGSTILVGGPVIDAETAKIKTLRQSGMEWGDVAGHVFVDVAGMGGFSYGLGRGVSIGKKLYSKARYYTQGGKIIEASEVVPESVRTGKEDFPGFRLEKLKPTRENYIKLAEKYAPDELRIGDGVPSWHASSNPFETVFDVKTGLNSRGEAGMFFSYGGSQHFLRLADDAVYSLSPGLPRFGQSPQWVYSEFTDVVATNLGKKASGGMGQYLDELMGSGKIVMPSAGLQLGEGQALLSGGTKMVEVQGGNFWMNHGGQFVKIGRYLPEVTALEMGVPFIKGTAMSFEELLLKSSLGGVSVNPSTYLPLAFPMVSSKYPDVDELLSSLSGMSNEELVSWSSNATASELAAILAVVSASKQDVSYTTAFALATPTIIRNDSSKRNEPISSNANLVVDYGSSVTEELTGKPSYTPPSDIDMPSYTPPSDIDGSSYTPPSDIDGSSYTPPPRDRGSFEKKIPKLVLGSKGSYQVEFQYGTGAREFHTVEADNYIMALDLGIRAKKQNLVPIEVELTKK